MAVPRTQQDRPRGRINLRVDPEQENRIRAAAGASGQSVTGFLLEAASERAERVLEGSRRIALDAEAFERFVAALDEPPTPMPTLRRYAEERSPIPPR